MNYGKFVYAILLLLLLFSCKPEDQDAMAKLKGMWKLDKYESFDSVSGEWHDAANRRGYTGYILYDGIGHMGVQLLPPGFKELRIDKDVDSLTKEELRKVLGFHLTSFNYFGNCKISKDGNSLEHDRLSSNNPTEFGTTVKRSIEFRRDTLILTADELIGGLRTRLRWLRL